ncbi:MAG: HlyD family efflux transporter periplasmic adaptor subunit [Deltaproteobacteria bacterium]|nr:HlyD family efflux transporter periplasmic adaptor subunit [Deltaproteobacteria bacterium]
MKRILARLLAGLAALAIAVLLGDALIPDPLRVETTVIERGRLVVGLEEEGQSRIREKYLVSAPTSGVALRLELHPGDAVTQGAVLSRLMPVRAPMLDAQSRLVAEGRLRAAEDTKLQTEAAIERSTQAVKQALVELERARSLAQQGAMPKRELELAEFEAQSRQTEHRALEFSARVAAHEVGIARASLEWSASGRERPLEVKSPVTGVVLRVFRESEGVVAAGTPILDVGDPRQLEVVADVLTRDVPRLERGLLCEISGWAGADGPVAARVRHVEPAAFPKVSPLGVEEQRVNVLVDFEGAPPTALGDGYSVDVRFILADLKDVLRVPSSAMFRSNSSEGRGGWAVFVVKDGRVQRRAIEVGDTDSLVFEVKSGLSAGERVVVHVGESVREGSRVEFL